MSVDNMIKVLFKKKRELCNFLKEIEQNIHFFSVIIL